MFWLILALALIIVPLAFFVRLNIATVERKRPFYVIKVTIMGIKLYKTAFCFDVKGIELRLLKINKRGYETVASPKKLLLNALMRKKRVKRINVAFLLKELEFKSGELTLNLGTGDAAATALACACARTVIEAVLNFFGIFGASVGVNADFNAATLKLYVFCILKAPAVQIIYRYFKQKGGS